MVKLQPCYFMRFSEFYWRFWLNISVSEMSLHECLVVADNIYHVGDFSPLVCRVIWGAESRCAGFSSIETIVSAL